MKTLREKINGYDPITQIVVKRDVEECFKDILNKIDKKIKGTFMTKELSYNDIEEIIKTKSGFEE